MKWIFMIILIVGILFAQVAVAENDVCGNPPDCEDVFVRPTDGSILLLARFKYTEISPLLVQFQDASVGELVSHASHEWDFGDGNVSAGKYVLHQYNETGTYNVSLTVRVNENIWARYYQEIEVVGGSSPVVWFAYLGWILPLALMPLGLLKRGPRGKWLFVAGIATLAIWGGVAISVFW